MIYMAVALFWKFQNEEDINFWIMIIPIASTGNGASQVRLKWSNDFAQSMYQNPRPEVIFRKTCTGVNAVKFCSKQHSCKTSYEKNVTRVQVVPRYMISELVCPVCQVQVQIQLIWSESVVEERRFVTPCLAWLLKLSWSCGLKCVSECYSLARGVGLAP